MYNGIIQKLCNGCILQMVVFIYWSNRIINRDYKNMFILFCPFFSLSSLHQIQSQAQRSIKRSINAFGMSELAGLECVYASSLSLRSQLSLIHRSIFSLLSRRAFIIPSFNFLGKSASDVISIDDCLFGNNFAEEVNL